MKWTASETLSLAQHSCAYCYGIGHDFANSARGVVPCKCVLRHIWKICHTRFRLCSLAERPKPARLQGSAMWGVKDAEYIADFCAIAKRTLGAESIGYQVFKLHYLLGAQWSACTRTLKIDRGEFFHEVYRVQQRLGQAFRMTEPYALFPLDTYFSPPARIAQRAA